MLYLVHLVHAYFMFVTPLTFLNYKSTKKQKILFTITYALGSILSRKIYSFFPSIFGSHTLILIILSSILFKSIVREFTWNKSIYTSLMLFIMLLINDTLIIVPVMNTFGLTVEKLETSISLTCIVSIVLNNLTLMIGLIICYLRNPKDGHVSLNSWLNSI